MAKLPYIWILLAAVGALPLHTAGAASPVPLLAHVEVETDAVALAQLLPENAPAALRRAFAEISLGAAPDFGASRSIRSGEIVSTVEAAGLPPRAFMIPNVVHIRRVGRTLTRTEVFRVIESSFQSRHPDARLPFSSNDLEISGSLRLPPGEANLRVVGFRYDEMLDREIFRLASASASLVPFVVAVRMPKLPGAPTKIASGLSAPPPSPVLVDPRYPARLLLISEDAEISLPVRPLQKGHRGDSIRVRMPQNGRTFFARVTGRGTLEASF
ncbi:MAG TPA: hypothetical protein VLV88_06130 [Terriglobales bacterium]|nr:hypothetical protein [Terriglobales bacterium]